MWASFACQHRRHRDMLAGQDLGNQDHVGLDAPMLNRKKATGATKSGLDFVRNEQGAVLPAQALDAGQVVVVRGGCRTHPHPLNRSS
jgi:hypothetical protein